MNKVVVKQDDNPKYDQTFECNRWLAIDEDDGLIVRELFADGQQFLDTITYHVKVKTGDVRNAGTGFYFFFVSRDYLIFYFMDIFSRRTC